MCKQNNHGCVITGECHADHSIGLKADSELSGIINMNIPNL